ncbi:acetyl-CoA carboxylase, carboxyl transferase, alpha subunit [Proteus penneri ATCC 35198]|nr:acetyl-CoA carboxylase, carboxyl transferase, alpha subunit [Proteus penneri ATCC 35198]
MSLNFLDFEQPIAELEAKIDSLTAVSQHDEKIDINIDEEVSRLREKSLELTRKIFFRSWCMASGTTCASSIKTLYTGLYSSYFY